MARRTLESGRFSPLVARQVLWYERDRDQVYYELDDQEEEEIVDDAANEDAQASSAPAPVAVAAPAPVAAPIVQAGK